MYKVPSTYKRRFKSINWRIIGISIALLNHCIIFYQPLQNIIRDPSTMQYIIINWISMLPFVGHIIITVLYYYYPYNRSIPYYEQLTRLLIRFFFWIGLIILLVFDLFAIAFMNGVPG